MQFYLLKEYFILPKIPILFYIKCCLDYIKIKATIILLANLSIFKYIVHYQLTLYSELQLFPPF